MAEGSAMRLAGILMGVAVSSAVAGTSDGSQDRDPPRPERVAVSADGRGFEFKPSGRPFVPWGVNYDHDETGRLIEDYWADEWPKIEEDFREIKDLGANVVRVHLQVGRFLKDAETTDRPSLDRLARLLDLAGRLGLYLDLTGLGCYHKADVPAWYDALDEAGRWAAQARFWEAVAARCAGNPAVFCYDLMNEPVVPGGKRTAGDWLGPGFGDKHFVQFLTLDGAGRPRPDVAKAWVRTLVPAIRKHDRETLITVGLVPWSLDRPKGLTSGTTPEALVGELDFLAVHLYPERGKVDEAIETLKGFALGKPVIIEETFPLKSGIDDLAAFVERSREIASGWVGFYWGQSIEDARKTGTIGGAITAEWLEYFRREAPWMTAAGPAKADP